MRKFFLLLVFIFFVGSVSAETIKEMVFLGDSLTDNGNLYRASHQIMPKSPPYYLGRFSNGPVWADILAEYYHTKYNITSSNYAVGGATTMLRRPRNGALPYYLKKEIDKHLSETDFSRRTNTMYFIWIGGNDYMVEKKQPLDKLVHEVTNEIVSQIKNLITNGGKNFVILDLPDFAKVPFANEVDQAEKERLHRVSELHHMKMAEVITQLRKVYPNFIFSLIDAYSITNDILLNVEYYNKKYGTHIINTQEACWSGGYLFMNENREKMKSDLQWDAMVDHVLNVPDLLVSYKVMQSQSSGITPCNNPDEYLFWDIVHPTYASHQLFSQLIIEKIESDFVLNRGR